MRTERHSFSFGAVCRAAVKSSSVQPLNALLISPNLSISLDSIRKKVKILCMAVHTAVQFSMHATNILWEFCNYYSNNPASSFLNALHLNQVFIISLFFFLLN